MQDCILISKIKRGDKNAFEQIYYKYSKILGYFLLGYLKSKEDAEEIIQETFLKVWENRSNLECESNFKSYLFQVSKNATINKLRRKNVEDIYRAYLFDHFFEADNSTENDIYFDDYQHIYQQVIEELPPRRKDIFLLSRQKGLTYDQIAKVMNISSKTVEKQMSEALKFVKKRLFKENTLWLTLFLMWTLRMFC